jgi:hypothetical protein
MPDVLAKGVADAEQPMSLRLNASRTPFLHQPKALHRLDQVVRARRGYKTDVAGPSRKNAAL